MNSSNILGDGGKKVLDACAKVKIFGRPETRRYESDIGRKCLKSCYGGKHAQHWMHTVLWMGWGQERFPDVSSADTVDIIDIHDALVRYDDERCVEKYPNERPGSDKLKDLIDKRREDIRRECEEATANPDGRQLYSWLVAQRRVRDCYASVFKCDRQMLKTKWRDEKTYNIDEIYEAFIHFDKLSSNGTAHQSGRRDSIDKNRAEVEREYFEATSKAHEDTKHEPSEYLYGEAKGRVEQSCYHPYQESRFPDEYYFAYNILPVEIDAKGRPKATQTLTIFDIHRALCHFDGKVWLQKYPEGGPGSDELTKLITAHRADLEKEFQEDKHRQRKYSRYEAERRVRDCFVGPFVDDTDIFPTKERESGILKINQTYDIFDIQKAIDYFDSKRFHDKYPVEGEPNFDEVRKKVDKKREAIERAYAEATASIEIEHGSGFIIQGHFIITNKHVVESALYDESKRTQIVISNESIGELPCEVAHHDTGKDLALLVCKDLKLDGQIDPLQLSKQSLLPGMQIFCFGFPVSHTEETALFVSGHVAGTKRTFSGHTKAVLNCALNPGNSGGPVLCWVNGELKVVGVATQKHFKEILTLHERETVEKIRKTLQTSVIPEEKEFEARYSSFLEDEICVEARSFETFLRRLGSSHYHKLKQHLDPRQIPLYLLTLKLYDALETHSQFNLSNAKLGDQVVEFIKDCITEYKGDYHDELTEVIKGL